jgi:transcriptional regulator GlxA family with amidase domain
MTALDAIGPLEILCRLLAALEVLILGAAGILSGIKATPHWAALDRLRTWK